MDPVKSCSLLIDMLNGDGDAHEIYASAIALTEATKRIGSNSARDVLTLAAGSLAGKICRGGPVEDRQDLASALGAKQVRRSFLTRHLLLRPLREDEMSRLKLKYWQRRRLRQQLKAASDARTYRRTLAVLELDRGRSAADIAAMLGVTRQSVHNWAAAFAREPDPSASGRRDRSGRPPLLAEQTEASCGP